MKKILLGILVLVAIGGIVGYILYNQPHRDIQRAEPDYTLSAPALYADFENAEATANERYLDKVIRVHGKVVELRTDDAGQTNVVLDGGGILGGVICRSDPYSKTNLQNLNAGEEVIFQGLCTGMLMDVVLVRCVRI